MERNKRVIATVINDVIYDQRMIRICSSLSSHGYDVKLIGRRKTNLPSSQRNFKQVRWRFLVNNGPWFYIIYNFRMFFYLLVARYDIVHAVDLDTLPSAYLASIIRSKKLVYDAHEYFTEVPELIHRPTKKKIWKWVEKRIVPKLKNTITVGAKIGELYDQEYGTDFKVVRNAPQLQTSFPEADLTLPSKFLIYQGALNKGRGLEVLIEAMVQIDIPLLIAGTGDLDLTLKNMVKEYDVEEKVTFLGMLEPETLRGISHRAFAGVNVSENLGLSYYYSLNNKYFDYIHAELPAITNEFPEYVELNSVYNCLIFARPEAKDIAMKVRLLIDDGALYKNLKMNCVLAKQHLNWSNEEKVLIGLYAEIS